MEDIAHSNTRMLRNISEDTLLLLGDDEVDAAEGSVCGHLDNSWSGEEDVEEVEEVEDERGGMKGQQESRLIAQAVTV